MSVELMRLYDSYAFQSSNCSVFFADSLGL